MLNIDVQVGSFSLPFLSANISIFQISGSSQYVPLYYNQHFFQNILKEGIWGRGWQESFWGEGLIPQSMLWVEICDNSFDTFLALNLKLIFSFSLQFQALVVELSVMISSFHLHFLSYSFPFAIVLVIFDVLVHVFDFLWIFVYIFCSAVWLNVFLHQTVLFLSPSFSRPVFDFLILFSPCSVLQVRANQ